MRDSALIVAARPNNVVQRTRATAPLSCSLNVPSPLMHGVSQHGTRPVNSTINLSFRYAESDYVRALRAHYASHLRLRLDIVVTVVLACVGAYLWRSPNLHWLGLTCVVISAAFALMLVAAFTVIPPLVFRREPKFRDDYSLTFSSEGIHFRAAH